MKATVTLILVLFIVLSTFPGHRICAEEHIRLANGEWPPYFSNKMKYGGVGSRIIKEAFRLKGIQVIYIFYPWKQNMEITRQGRVDGAVGWNRSKEREKLFLYSDAVIHGTHSFFYIKNKPFHWNTLDDLKEMVIGGTVGYNYGEEFQKAEKIGQIRIIRNETDIQNLASLLQGKINLFIVNPDVGFYLIQQYFRPEERKKFACHSKPLRTSTNHVIFPKQNSNSERLLHQFNDGLRQLKANGKYDQYVNESRRGEYTNFKQE